VDKNRCGERSQRIAPCCGFLPGGILWHGIGCFDRGAFAASQVSGASVVLLAERFAMPAMRSAGYDDQIGAGRDWGHRMPLAF